MATGQTASQQVDSDEPLSDRVAGQAEATLDVVRELLRARGFLTCRVSRIGLCLDGRRGTFGVVRRKAPELLVYAPHGAKVAEVTVGARSGAYLVSVAGNAANAHPVPADQPDLVARLLSDPSVVDER
ncbi:hypothetical protein [Thermoactinospora rubra]|uniref:hypothetical protein n=1 Tax=Thermoactinospora rubra TaxID=1088767 RepID=UPI000A120598|nr:hypothetical protein [Thermoactinospora rubra]